MMAGVVWLLTSLMVLYSLGIVRTDKDADLFKFASYYASHMVLQRAPQSAGMWGYAALKDIGRAVKVTVNAAGNNHIAGSYQTTVKQGPFPKRAVWSVALAPESSTESFTITATLSGYPSLHLVDVLFGDVWICSGQSNMQFNMDQIYGTERTELDAANFTKIRLFNNERVTSSKPLYDLQKIIFNWLPPATKGWDSFSAVCYLYGTYMYKALGYPIGLIDTSWGGTRIECWSSPDALKQCGIHIECGSSCTGDDPVQFAPRHASPYLPVGEEGVPTSYSVLWNAMMHPFLNMTIKGALWYQGEANANFHTQLYNCTFPAMIENWRKNFYLGSHGRNVKVFPFGFVQIGPNHQSDPGYPDIRWHQMGDSPSGPTVPESFMAVSIDLADPASPYGPVHYRDKRTAARRLAEAGLLKAFGRGTDTHLYPTSDFVNMAKKTLTITFQNDKYPISVRDHDGFEVCCAARVAGCPFNSNKTGWLATPITGNNKTAVSLSWAACKQKRILGYRYAWSTVPCAYLRCAVYSDWTQNPLPSFVKYFSGQELENMRWEEKMSHNKTANENNWFWKPVIDEW